MRDMDLAGKLLLALVVVVTGIGALAALCFILYSIARVLAYGWHRGKTEALERFYKDQCEGNPEQEIDDA